MTRLLFLRLDVAKFYSAEHMALPKRCSVALTLRHPVACFSRWNTFTSLKRLCINWGGRASGWRWAQPFYLLAALPSTVKSVDIKYPRACRVSSQLTLPHTLLALRLRADGRADGQEPLSVSMHGLHAAPHPAAVGRPRSLLGAALPSTH